jgi:hypothetical protein
MAKKPKKPFEAHITHYANMSVCKFPKRTIYLKHFKESKKYAVLFQRKLNKKERAELEKLEHNQELKGNVLNTNLILSEDALYLLTETFMQQLKNEYDGK